MLLIITGTITPANRVGQLVLKDTTERFKQYYDSLTFYIEQRCFSKIVFCENSNYGTEEFEPLTELAKEYNVELELLSFEGNTDKVIYHGKGYGEGEIMQYILANSSLIKGENVFVKTTGRLKVTNINRILLKIRPERCYFNVSNHTARHIYDTRLYIMPIELFKKYFLNVKEQVKDDEGIYLENIYTNIILKNAVNTRNFPLYPRINGLSASTGERYSFIEWKSKIKDILSKLNFYGKIKPLKG